ncbi:hypothetical protein Leryth_018363 [Lithospermum erythrorhizon]|nr:hypothetical protein Leryth_018363 [Lithospermum erythrorhizon]
MNLLSISATFGRKKTSRPFKDYYNEWFNSLEKTLLPQLQNVMLTDPISPSQLSIHVTTMQQHFQAYYNALDVAASDDIAQVLYPEWRNSLEKPFIWMGDLHPYLLTNLLRSFLDVEEEAEHYYLDTNEHDHNDDGGVKGDDGEGVIKIGKDSEFCVRPYEVAMAYRSPSKTLSTRVEQIECGLRLMVPALVVRARNVQAAFVERVGGEWEGGKRDEAKAVIGEAMVAEMEELAGVFLDANRLRRSVFSDILSVTNVYQAAVFLEGLAQFLVGFKNNTLLREFDKCKLAN